MNNSSHIQSNQTSLEPICNTILAITTIICATYLIDRHFDDIKDTVIGLSSHVKRLAINWRGINLVFEPHKEQSKALPESTK